jgi:hypothetical protein
MGAAGQRQRADEDDGGRKETGNQHSLPVSPVSWLVRPPMSMCAQRFPPPFRRVRRTQSPDGTGRPPASHGSLPEHAPSGSGSLVPSSYHHHDAVSGLLLFFPHVPLRFFVWLPNSFRCPPSPRTARCGREPAPQETYCKISPLRGRPAEPFRPPARVVYRFRAPAAPLVGWGWLTDPLGVLRVLAPCLLLPCSYMYAGVWD